jgi:hypothetical protein
MPAGGGCLISPAWGCLGYQIFSLGAVPEARSHSLENSLDYTLTSRFSSHALNA